MAITAAQTVALTDYIGAAYLALAGTSVSGLGCGNANVTLTSDWGFSKQARQFQNSLMATQDYDVVKILGAAAAEMVLMAPVQNVARSMFFQTLSRLDQACGQAGLTGVTSLETFALYYDTGPGGPNNCMLSPAFGQLWQLIFQAPLNAAVLYTAGSPPGGRTNQPVVPGI